MAALENFARLPTRQKVMVFVVIGILAGLVYKQFVFNHLRDDLEAAEGEQISKAKLNRQYEHDIGDFQELKQRMIPLKRLIDENQKALPTEAELPAFFETLNRKGIEAGIDVIRSTQGQEQRIESFIKVPINYEIQGTFLQIKKFFASLLPKKKKVQTDATGEAIEERERIVSIENLTLNNPVVRNREIILTARFIASTFRQEEASGPPPKPIPKPAAPAASPAQLPPASTPKGARERTERALDKGVQRNGNATGVDEAKTPAGADRMKGGL